MLKDRYFPVLLVAKKQDSTYQIILGKGLLLVGNEINCSLSVESQKVLESVSADMAFPFLEVRGNARTG